MAWNGGPLVPMQSVTGSTAKARARLPERGAPAAAQSKTELRNRNWFSRLKAALLSSDIEEDAICVCGECETCKAEFSCY